MRVRRAAGRLALLCALTFLPGPVNAGEPPHATELFSAASAGTGLSEPDIQALAEHAGISRDEATHRMELQAHAADLEASVAVRWPDTFAGLWLRTESAGIEIAFTDVPEDFGTVLAGFPYPHAVSLIDAKRSLQELVSLQQTMGALRAALQEGRVVGPVAPALLDTAGFYDLGIDVEANQVIVYAVERNNALTSAFQAIYGDAVRVQDGVTNPACFRQDCRYTMRGGLWLTKPNLSQLCTASFTAFTNLSTYYTLSAGHCSRDSGEYVRYHAGVHLGAVNLRQTQYTVDAERILRQNSVWFMSASIFVETNDIRPIYYHISWESTAVNAFVGKSGMTTGTTRGYITDKWVSPHWITNGYNFIRTSACAQPGDSGAPVFQNNTAYGIVSGATLGQCTTASSFVFGNILYAMQTLQVSLLSA
jgi:hypothetical protein